MTEPVESGAGELKRADCNDRPISDQLRTCGRSVEISVFSFECVMDRFPVSCAATLIPPNGKIVRSSNLEFVIL